MGEEFLDYNFEFSFTTEFHKVFHRVSQSYAQKISHSFVLDCVFLPQSNTKFFTEFHKAMRKKITP